MFSETVLLKAYDYVAGRVLMREPGVWTVRGSKPYTVRTDADPEKRTVTWASCSCPHGTQAPVSFPRCSHVAAVLIVVREGIEVPLDPDAEQPEATPCTSIWLTGRGEDPCQKPAGHPGAHRGKRAEWWPEAD